MNALLALPLFSSLVLPSAQEPKPKDPATKDPSESAQHAPSQLSLDDHRSKRPTRSTWAQLMKRVFAIDVLVCPHCSGSRKWIALLTDGPLVRKILAHLGLPTNPPLLAPARVPPELQLAW